MEGGMTKYIRLVARAGQGKARYETVRQGNSEADNGINSNIVPQAAVCLSPEPSLPYVVVLAKLQIVCIPSRSMRPEERFARNRGELFATVG